MQTIQSFLNSQQREVYSVSPNQTVWEALQVMAQHNIGAVLVVNNDKMVGIFSERDYARRVEPKGLLTKETLVGQIMTSKFITIQPSRKMDECMQIMTENRVRHLPVMDQQENILGLVSIGDVVSEMIHEQRLLIDQLRHYIAG
jgi:CBS domain-containing protein